MGITLPQPRHRSKGDPRAMEEAVQFQQALAAPTTGALTTVAAAPAAPAPAAVAAPAAPGTVVVHVSLIGTANDQEKRDIEINVVTGTGRDLYEAVMVAFQLSGLDSRRLSLVLPAMPMLQPPADNAGVAMILANEKILEHRDAYGNLVTGAWVFGSTSWLYGVYNANRRECHEQELAVQVAHPAAAQRLARRCASRKGSEGRGFDLPVRSLVHLSPDAPGHSCEVDSDALNTSLLPETE
ncbi:hypothetical protein DFJ74DRAFT_652810 [Hyaloraphidium curvatum]|nr:hypothetical protein DFJ74DRAFT_652810 [Hyaloraphidium curvatum]